MKNLPTQKIIGTTILITLSVVLGFILTVVFLLVLLDILHKIYG